jgi:molybdopterin biosynthesis enzyme
MHLQTVPVEEAVGNILVHNIADETGRKAFSKGHVVREEDLEKLVHLGRREVYVAALEPGDVHEDQAAARLAEAVAGPGITLGRAAAGRVNLHAAQRGLLKVDASAVDRINDLDGLTVATLHGDTVVSEKQMVATIKIVPFAVPGDRLERAEAMARERAGAVQVQPFRPTNVALVLTGSEATRERVVRAFEGPLRERVEALGSRMMDVTYVPENEIAIAEAIGAAIERGADLVILAGETSIMDADDITPRGIRRAGGQIEHYGAPVEPGHLLLLAYCGSVPILGAPGCARSRRHNVVDIILPRLLAGERLTRADIVALGVGGLMVGAGNR